MTNTTLKAVTAASLVMLLGISQQSLATTKDRKVQQGASGVCDAVYPASDIKLQRLSVGMRNVATTNVTIACSLWSDDLSTGPLSQVFIYFKNHTTTTKTVSCTLATSPFYGLTYRTKTLSVTGGTSDFLTWGPTDYPASTRTANLTCTVPPSFSAQEIGVKYVEDVGA